MKLRYGNPASLTFVALVAALLCLEGAAFAQDQSSKSQLDFFETKIRPVLVESCYACHSTKTGESQGGLVLDSRDGIRRGGDSGPAVVPGKIKSSLLIAAIRHTTDDLVMPPDGDGEKLSDAVIRDFESWIRMGAPDPRDGMAPGTNHYDTSEGLDWWAFQPIKPTQPPASVPPQFASWPLTSIDRFVASKWEEHGLSPVDDAEPHALLRRLRFDLTGLPPNENEVTYFLHHWQQEPDRRDALIEKVVDSLLNSPEYAERWGRHWLDVARFAESSGKDVNLVYPHAWRYRDYVIESFRKDKPFDQFVREQIAGDLLPAKNASQQAEQLTATAFLALGELPINERNAKQFAVDMADDQIGTVSQAFLGMTTSCARCHDHRFDPVSQKDYTALAGIFLSTETKYGTAGAVGGRNRATLIELSTAAKLPVVADGLSSSEIRSKQQKMERLQQQQRSARQQRAGGGRATDGLTDFDLVRINTQVSQLEFELSMVNEDGSAKPLTMGVGDRPVTAPQSRRGGSQRGRPERGDQQGRREQQRPRRGPGNQMQMRGPQNQRGQRAPGGMRRGNQNRVQQNPFFQGNQESGSDGQRERQQPASMEPQRGNRASGFEQIGDSPLFLRGSIENVGDTVPRGIPGLLGTGEDILIRSGSGRMELANALVADENTLTARVIVNRVWHWLFGKGLVESVDNFGTTGLEPANAELLDYLSHRFVQNGWSIKMLIRDITLSRVYRLSSDFSEPNFTSDPDNKMLWRHSSRRLEAEEIRDAILAASGQLNLKPDVGSMIGRAGDGPIGGLRFQAVTLDQISESDHKFRSVYLPTTRNVEPAVLAVFDPANASTTNGSRNATNVPAQGLFLLNSDFVTKHAATLAKLALRQNFGGETNEADTKRVKATFRRVLNRDATDTEVAAALKLLNQLNRSRDAWTSVVRGLFGSAEFRFVD